VKDWNQKVTKFFSNLVLSKYENGVLKLNSEMFYDIISDQEKEVMVFFYKDG
jgi:hypothetical protein